MRARLCGLIFLISSLPRADLLTDLGVRATAETLADLIVDDLTGTSAELRGRIPLVLKDLTDKGQLLLSPSGEYSIQTGESLQWEKVFQHHAQSISGVPQKIGEALYSANQQAPAGDQPAADAGSAGADDAADDDVVDAEIVDDEGEKK